MWHIWDEEICVQCLVGRGKETTCVNEAEMEIY